MVKSLKVEKESIGQYPGHGSRGHREGEVDQEWNVGNSYRHKYWHHFAWADLGAFHATLAGIYIVGFLIKDVVDSINQQVEGESDPNKERNDVPAP